MSSLANENGSIGFIINNSKLTGHISNCSLEKQGKAIFYLTYQNFPDNVLMLVDR